ncbi:MAG: type II secretion system protein [Candidatus Peribacteraceae bacterium]|jgi:prepilin-type N-terminal cleavage/methylation domain-containing protein
MRRTKPGFTVIELLLAVSILSTLSSVVIMAIAPRTQILKTRDVERSELSQQLSNSMESRMLDEQTIAEWNAIPECTEENRLTCAKRICKAGAGCPLDEALSLESLVPAYITHLPVDIVMDMDDVCTGFMVYKQRGRPRVFSPNHGKLPGETPRGGCKPQVAYHHIFYNNSSYDGYDASPSPEDDAAIAPDKVVLLPGETSSFVNYTNYEKGLNGIMVDLAFSPNPAGITAADFTFQQSFTWAVTMAPSSVTVREGAGVGGSDRVTIIWPDNVLQRKWVRVTVLATPNTGLEENEVHYWGNAIGEADVGNEPLRYNVNYLDEEELRARVTSSASITNKYDVNRDGVVDAVDELIAHNNPAGYAPGSTNPGGPYRTLRVLTATEEEPEFVYE